MPTVGVAVRPHLVKVVWSGCRRVASAEAEMVTFGEADPGGGRRAGSALYPAANLEKAGFEVHEAILAVSGDSPLAGGADAVPATPYRPQQIMAAATALLSQEEDRT